MSNSNNLFGPDEHLGSEFVTPDEIFSGGNVENIKVIVGDGSGHGVVVEFTAEEGVFEEV